MAGQAKPLKPDERRRRPRASLWGATEAQFEQHKASHRRLLAVRTKIDPGLVKALGLTPEEHDHLSRFSAWYEGLCSGRIAPLTEFQRHFIEVYYGRQQPQDDHERLWLRWREAFANGADEQVETLEV
jgi:uncharacterized protein YifE (UPF0438 family)